MGRDGGIEGALERGVIRDIDHLPAHRVTEPLEYPRERETDMPAAADQDHRRGEDHLDEDRHRPAAREIDPAFLFIEELNLFRGRRRFLADHPDRVADDPMLQLGPADGPDRAAVGGDDHFRARAGGRRGFASSGRFTGCCGRWLAGWPRRA